MKIGTQVDSSKFDEIKNCGNKVVLIDIIKAGKKPSAKQLEFYGEDYPPSVENSIRFHRYVFQKENGNYFIVPELLMVRKCLLYTTPSFLNVP